MTDPPHAYLLAGGHGTRLRPLTDDTPKPLLSFLSEPILRGWMRRLAAASIRHVHLLVGEDPTPFRYLVDDGARLGLIVSIHTESSPLRSGGALRAAPQTGRHLLVVNGDVVTGASISTMLDRPRRTGADATLLATQHPDPDDYGARRPSATD